MESSFHPGPSWSPTRHRAIHLPACREPVRIVMHEEGGLNYNEIPLIFIEYPCPEPRCQGTKMDSVLFRERCAPDQVGCLLAFTATGLSGLYGVDARGTMTSKEGPAQGPRSPFPRPVPEGRYLPSGSEPCASTLYLPSPRLFQGPHDSMEGVSGIEKNLFSILVGIQPDNTTVWRPFSWQ